MNKKLFILYDGRASGGDTDIASVMETCESEKECRRSGIDSWNECDAIWFEYDIGKDLLTGENILENERMRPDLPPYSK